MAVGSHITERELTEASSVSAHGSGHQYEIQLGHMCNNRCVFCSSGQLTAMRLAKPIPLDPMIAAIEQARAGGARRITFLGGEPTLHRSFFGALERSVQLGFEEIVIFTNGVLLPQPGFIDRIVALGNFEWRISIQGANRDAHVAVTAKPDSFRRIVDGMKLLRARGQRITANMCVNERSYRSLPDYPALVKEHDIRQLHIDVVRPSSTGQRDEAYLRDIMPRYSDMAPYMAEMLERFDRELPGFDVSLGNLPLCVLPKWTDHISHGGDETIIQSCDESALEVAVDKYRWHATLRRHVPACDGCALRGECTGIFSTYLETYGDSEFHPITREALKALGAEAHHFVLFVEPILAPLKAATPPEGWRLDNWISDRRQRHIDVCLRHESGSVALRFDPPGTAPADLATSQYRLTAIVSPALSEAALMLLVDWLERQLSTEGLREALRMRRRRTQGRARIQQLIARLTASGWRISRQEETPTGTGVALENRDGNRIDLAFTIHADTDRPRISVDAPLGASVSAAMREALRALREPVAA